MWLLAAVLVVFLVAGLIEIVSASRRADIREFNPVPEFQEVGLDKASVAGACGIHRAPGAVAAQDNQLVALVAFANDLGVLTGFSSRLTYPPVSVGMAVAM